ncbi:EpsG family protein [Peribacillus simplex]|uniref:EpsG family protein n=2 Tax=Peribacillus TaxID=2675229 RepID=A0AA90PBB9_9BACI|nr:MULTISPECIES: EpsG family protein [Peribacillus]MDP1417452.1 EpsG family protein [Peribacillus simplex]MDP1450107.1 EpsG family protein [Peribacillus frigoritolerans]
MDNLQSYFLYYLLIISTSIIVQFSQLINKTIYKKFSLFIFWSALLFPFLISANRYGIGTDYFDYVALFHELEGYGNIFDAIKEGSYEPGWIILNFIVKMVFDNYKYVFVLSSFLTLFFLFKAIYSYRDRLYVGIGIFIFMSTLYNSSFNITRQILAASILLYAVKYIEEKKILKYALLTLFAASFHYSALIFLPIYWVLVSSRNNNWNLLKKIIFSIVTIFIIVLFDFVFGFITSIEFFSKYSSYQLNVGKTDFNNLIINLPIMIIILMNLKTIKLRNKFIYDLITLYFIGIVLSFLGYFNNYIGRATIYFSMSQILIIPFIIKVQTNKYIKLFYMGLIVLYYIILFTYNIIIQNGHETIPYIWR